MTGVRALALFSGGLDSILAARVVAAQGIEVLAVKFVTPFFGYEILADIPGYTKEMREKYGIEVLVEDISADYLELLRHPRHGFGKHFNPCIDCKIFMLNRAREMMAELGAAFLVTGEVLGQRPMSQRLDTLHVISRDSGSRPILLRPLSAKLLPETIPERDGLVDRERLFDFSGRGRSRQIALAAEFGITDFPAPAGGCILADPILSRRIERLYGDRFVLKPENITVADVRLLLVGRQFILPGGGWLILGRIEKENERIAELAGPDDALLFMEERPGPTALIRNAAGCYKEVGCIPCTNISRAKGVGCVLRTKETPSPERCVQRTLQLPNQAESIPCTTFPQPSRVHSIHHPPEEEHTPGIFSQDLHLAAGLVVRYGRKEKGVALPGEVMVIHAGKRWIMRAEPLDDKQSAGWML